LGEILNLWENIPLSKSRGRKKQENRASSLEGDPRNPKQRRTVLKLKKKEKVAGKSFKIGAP